MTTEAQTKTTANKKPSCLNNHTQKMIGDT